MNTKNREFYRTSRISGILIKINYAWNEIAKYMDLDVEVAKKKISCLLDLFRREKPKGRKTLRTGKGNRTNSLIKTRFVYYFINIFCNYLGTREVYKSDWFTFNIFIFLMNKDHPKETLSSENINECMYIKLN